MKRIFVALFVFGVVSTCSVRADDIVFVDLEEVVKGFYKTQLAIDQLKQQHQDIQQERQEMEAEITEMKKSIDELRNESRDATLSEEIRNNKLNALEEQLIALQKKEAEMIEFEKLRNNQLSQQQMRMTRKIHDEVRDVIQMYAKNKGHSAVIDRSAQGRTGLPVVLFMHGSVDVTADVLAELNKGREIKDEKTFEVGKE